MPDLSRKLQVASFTRVQDYGEGEGASVGVATPYACRDSPFSLWAAGHSKNGELWAMGYGLRAMGYGEQEGPGSK